MIKNIAILHCRLIVPVCLPQRIREIVACIQVARIPLNCGLQLRYRRRWVVLGQIKIANEIMQVRLRRGVVLKGPEFGNGLQIGNVLHNECIGIIQRPVLILRAVIRLSGLVEAVNRCVISRLIGFGCRIACRRAGGRRQWGGLCQSGASQNCRQQQGAEKPELIISHGLIVSISTKVRRCKRVTNHASALTMRFGCVTVHSAKHYFVYYSTNRQAEKQYAATLDIHLIFLYTRFSAGKLASGTLTFLYGFETKIPSPGPL